MSSLSTSPLIHTIAPLGIPSRATVAATWYKSPRRGSRILILIAHDIVFPQIGARLRLDQHNGHFTLIFMAVASGSRDVDRMVLPKFAHVFPLVTVAVPATITQCSARCWWLCSGLDAPGFTRMRFTWKRSPRAMPSNQPHGHNSRALTMTCGTSSCYSLATTSPTRPLALRGETSTASGW